MKASKAPLVAGAVILIAALAILGEEASAGSRLRGKLEGGRGHEIALSDCGDYGRLASMRLESAAFPASGREEGYDLDGEVFPRQGHYDDPSVAVFFPRGFEPGNRVDLVFFFHGWYSSISESARDFELFRQFAESGTRALLVIPETARDAPDSFGGKLEESEGFDRLVAELLGALRENRLIPSARAGSITLIGHSGAYRVISRILGQSGAAARVREVCLFDGLYEELPRFEDWIASGRGRFICFCAREGDPQENARGLAARLRERGIFAAVAEDDPSADAAALGQRVAFISSPYDHGSLINEADELRRVLAAGVSRH